MSRHPRHPRPPRTTALIAEDEPLLAASLQAELARLWPDLQVLASVGDGHSALAQALALRPDVLFFDIRMPGLSGLDAAAALADAWDTTTPGAKPFPALVFVTAYDQYAVQAFEAQAVDYLLKPVQPDRLQKTIQKLQQSLASKRTWVRPKPLVSAVVAGGAVVSQPRPVSVTAKNSRLPCICACTWMLPPATLGSSPWRMLFSTSGCSSSGGTGTARSSSGRSRA